LPKLAALAILRPQCATAAGAGSPFPLMSGSGRRPQRPGNQFAFARVSDMSPGDSPSRITGCCRPCRNHPASSENSHVFAAPTLSQNPAARNKKTPHACAKTVDEMPSLWKPEENRERFRIISALLRIDIASLEIRLALVCAITEAAPRFRFFTRPPLRAQPRLGFGELSF
jgi:hypothetical protein